MAKDCVAVLEDRLAELPGRKARRAAPRRRVAMLVVVSRGEVLLEKRPAKGVWGGLWSLPEADAAAKPAKALAEGWGLAAAKSERLAPFEHAFSHFTLEVVPWRLSLARGAKPVEPKGTAWLPLSEVAGAALPAPVKKLLASLARAAPAPAGSGGARPGARRRR